ncbi:glycosyltransferase family 2 protein [Cystobasidium minutum MCA 4210]|uniref:glycosyltransferase family 2 protein n=1 Tax=Cystobasidium minutum MCA 4210 TaxID=1397322 RepID=UPI0034CD695A|eukprot:jgi/Rhomi1/206893/MIX7722_2260_100
MASNFVAKLRFAWWWVCVVAKLGFAGSLVIGILVAYGLRFSVTSAGPFTLGLYGVVILADFIVQTTCAFANRKKTERLAKRCEKAGVAPLDIIIAVVGYREDSEAWKKCLHSLQKQDCPPRVIVGVVDGQDGPDQSMAQDFATCFPPETTLIADLPELLSKEYTDVYWANMPPPPPKTWKNRLSSWKRSIANLRTEDELRAEAIAWKAIEAKWKEWDAEHDFNKYKAVCLTQPHGHKRTAMFTAFTLAMLVYKAQDAVFTTDSDTILDPPALRQMSYVLGSDPDIAGVTGDVKIWNKNESWLALMCALRYWFAFNIERACQSYYRCVTCISGPIGLYRTADMRVILGPWVLQTFLGRDCTFGDDRHLTNRLLGEGRKTAYTHLAFCESDSPAGFVRWVKQQTRWSKSFFREAFWFPAAFAKHSVWLSIETFKQTLYPFILISTIFQFLYAPTTLLRPVFWLATMFGVAGIKSTYAWILTGDPKMMLFSLYGLFYFFGLLPSKIFALLTINVTAWGTSARSTAERKKRESL